MSNGGYKRMELEAAAVAANVSFVDNPMPLSPSGKYPAVDDVEETTTASTSDIALPLQVVHVRQVQHDLLPPVVVESS